MDRFDIVVVGAGSAGAVLAAPSFRGSRHLGVAARSRARSHVGGRARRPAIGELLPRADGARSHLAQSRRDPGGGSAGIAVRTGRGAGGSSSVNAMCAIRGTRDDYERWASELGCSGWGWPEMLDAFLRVEDDADYGGDDLHGKGGPIPLARLPFETLPPLDRAMRTALTELGYPTADDYHAVGATGISRGAMTLRDGRRVSTNDAYLEPARPRANLSVRGDVLVDRVLFDGSRAVGVRTATGAEIEAGEVIVSAGAIHSPAILLRSGVGWDRRPPGRREPQGPRRHARLRARAEGDGVDAVGGSTGLQLDVAVHVGAGGRGTERHADRLVRRHRADR